MIQVENVTVCSPLRGGRQRRLLRRIRGGLFGRSGPGSGNARIMQRKNRNVFKLLDDVSMDIDPGESVGLIGVNGAGKSTLLRTIGGIYRPTYGNVRVRGRVTPLVGLNSGFVPELSGLNNIFIVGALLEISRDELARRVPDIVEFAELQDFIDEPLSTYSSGMVARLGFAITTVVLPDVLLLDEILSVGDGAFRAKCRNLIDSIIGHARLVCICSHDMSTIREYCRRAVWMHQGRIAMDGPAEEVVAGYQEFLKDETKRPAADTDPGSVRAA